MSPVAVGLALLLVYNGRTGWFGPTLENAGFQVIFAAPGMIMATCFVALPLVILLLVVLHLGALLQQLPRDEKTGQAEEQPQRVRTKVADRIGAVDPDRKARRSDGVATDDD